MKPRSLGILVPITLIALAIMSGCAGPVVVSSATPAVIPSPTALPAASATVTSPAALNPTTSATGTPPAALNPTALHAAPTRFRPSPTPTTWIQTPGPYFALDMTPSEVTVAAGETVIITAGPAGFESAKRFYPQWYVARSIEGAPPYTTIAGQDTPMSFIRPFVIMTSCRTPSGTYTLTFHTASYNQAEPTQYAQAKLTVTPPVLHDSPMGTFTTTSEIIARFGGPTTEFHAVGSLVTLCDTDPPRRLRITVQAATSRAGTPMAKLPSVGMYRVLPGDAMGGIYDALKGTHVPIQPANDRGEWELAGGPYVIIFGQYFPISGKPLEQRVRSVTYALEIVQ